MSDRSFTNHPYNDERFNRRGRGKGSSRNSHPRPNLDEIKDRVSQDIVEVARTRMRGQIIAHNLLDAVNQLAKRLKHSKNLIDAAFRNLVKTNIFRWNEEKLCYELMAI